jgi:predicted SpoU family rRNA methylase
MVEIVVFRYGHRLERDKRTTTHCALVARVLGAKEIIYTEKKILLLKIVF